MSAEEFLEPETPPERERLAGFRVLGLGLDHRGRFGNFVLPHRSPCP